MGKGGEPLNLFWYSLSHLSTQSYVDLSEATGPNILRGARETNNGALMSDVAGNNIDLNEFDAEIIRLAQLRFEKDEPALINALGIQLAPKLGLAKAQTGLSFMQYLEKRLSDQFDIIQVKPNTPGLWPKGKAHEAAVSAFAQRPRPQIPRRYLRWFWNAFAEPIADGKRFFDPNERAIVDAELAENPSWLEIPATLVRRADETRSVREIHRNIDEWLRANRLSGDDFLDKTTQLPEPSAAGRSLLDLVLGSLTQRQLQTVMVPLDVT